MPAGGATARYRWRPGGFALPAASSLDLFEGPAADGQRTGAGRGVLGTLLLGTLLLGTLLLGTLLLGTLPLGDRGLTPLAPSEARRALARA